jgi:hypothetical protein
MGRRAEVNASECQRGWRSAVTRVLYLQQQPGASAGLSLRRMSSRRPGLMETVAPGTPHPCLSCSHVAHTRLLVPCHAIPCSAALPHTRPSLFIAARKRPVRHLSLGFDRRVDVIAPAGRLQEDDFKQKMSSIADALEKTEEQLRNLTQITDRDDQQRRASVVSSCLLQRRPLRPGWHGTAWHGMARHACHAVPCRAVPCHAVPCRAMPCHAVPCRAMPCRAMPCCAMPCHAPAFRLHSVREAFGPPTRCPAPLSPERLCHDVDVISSVRCVRAHQAPEMIRSSRSRLPSIATCTCWRKSRVRPHTR